LYLVTFLSSLSLEMAGKLMKQIGCYEAVKLDGGASRALAHDGTTIVHAGRPLTNVIIVYDKFHPAPRKRVESWCEFQQSARHDFK